MEVAVKRSRTYFTKTRTQLYTKYSGELTKYYSKISIVLYNTHYLNPFKKRKDISKKLKNTYIKLSALEVLQYSDFQWHVKGLK